MRGFASIGAFKVQGSGPAQASHVFGRPTGEHETASDCTLTWPGSKISF